MKWKWKKSLKFPHLINKQQNLNLKNKKWNENVSITAQTNQEDERMKKLKCKKWMDVN